MPKATEKDWLDLPGLLPGANIGIVFPEVKRNRELI